MERTLPRSDSSLAEIPDEPRRPPIGRAELYAELWTSLAALMRSYTALHGLSLNRTAVVEHTERRIRVRHGEKLLLLARRNETVSWVRENGDSGNLELTAGGSLRGPSGEQAMDLAAEYWARELMQ